MAVKIAGTTGNLTAAGTWQDVNATGFLDTQGSTQFAANTWQGPVATAFTPGAITIDGIILKLAYAGASGGAASGTFSTRLYNNTDAAIVAGTTVTINIADLDTNGHRPYVNVNVESSIGWVYFKFSAPVLLVAGKAYIIQFISSVSNEVAMYYTGVNYTVGRGVVVSGASAAAPTTGDQMFISGLFTGAGAMTPVTVTMDQTSSAVKYGTTSTSLTSVHISKGGTLAFGYAAATNYYFNVQGIFNIALGGTFTVGTVANPIPRDSTATVNLDITGSSGAYYITCSGTITAQGLSRTVGKNVVACLLSANHTGGGTAFTVDRDTGWKSGDEVVIAGTTRTNQRTEWKVLNGDAAAGSFNISVASSYDHIGDVANGLQAEVINLTRNVVFSTTTAGKGTALFAANYSIVDFDWVYFKGFGFSSSSPAAKGIGFNNNDALNVDYCSFNPNGTTSGYALAQHASSGSVAPQFALTFTHNVGVYMTNFMYDFNGASNLYTTFDVTIEDNWVLGNTTNGYAGFVTDRHIQRNLTVRRCRIGDGSSAESMLFATSDVYPYQYPYPKRVTITDCVFHDMNYAIKWSGTICGFTTIQNCKFWNVKSTGGYPLYSTNTITDVLVDDCEFIGNYYGAYYMAPGTSVDELVFRNCKFGGRTSYATQSAVVIGGSSGDGKRLTMRFENCLFGDAAGGIYLDHATGDFDVGSIQMGQFYDITFNNCNSGSTTKYTSNFLLSCSYRSVLRYQREQGVLGAHRVYYPRLGVVARDATVYRSSPASEKMTPSSAMTTYVKLMSTPKRFDVTLGAQRSPSVWVKIDVTYNGSAPRLMMKANPALGQDDPVVLATHSLVTGTWVQLVGTMPTVAEDEGQMEVYVDCDGTAGNVWVDDWSI